MERGFFSPSLFLKFILLVGCFSKPRHIFWWWLRDNEKLVTLLQATATLQNNTLVFLSALLFYKVSDIWSRYHPEFGPALTLLWGDSCCHLAFYWAHSLLSLGYHFMHSLWEAGIWMSHQPKEGGKHEPNASSKPHLITFEMSDWEASAVITTF